MGENQSVQMQNNPAGVYTVELLYTEARPVKDVLLDLILLEFEARFNAMQ